MQTITEARTNRPNVHIAYEQAPQLYHSRVAQLVVKHTGNSPNVLDIGCGVGHTLSEIKKRKPRCRLVAADIDDTVLAITQEHAQVDETIQIGSVEDLFDGDRRYDAIIFSHVLEHTQRPVEIVRGLTEMLSVDGVLVLAVPNPVRLDVIVGNVVRRHYVNRGHVFTWDRSHWMNFLDNIVGARVLEYSQDFFPIPFLQRATVLRPIQVRLASVFPWFAFSNIAVVSRK